MVTVTKANRIMGNRLGFQVTAATPDRATSAPTVIRLFQRQGFRSASPLQLGSLNKAITPTTTTIPILAIIIRTILGIPATIYWDTTDLDRTIRLSLELPASRAAPLHFAFFISHFALCTLHFWLYRHFSGCSRRSIRDRGGSSPRLQRFSVLAKRLDPLVF